MPKKIKVTWASNVTDAAKLTNISLPRIKKIRELGCAAFRSGGRVNITELKAWIKANPESVPVDSDSESTPNIEIEEAFKMRADRQRSEQRVLREAKLVVPTSQPLRAFNIVAKLFVSRLYILGDRLCMMHKLDKDEIRKELDAVVEPLSESEFEKLLTDGDKAES